MEINNNNFLRWAEYPYVKDTKFVPCPYPTEKNNLPYMPVLVPGEVTAFYVNVANGVEYTKGFKLNLITPDGTIILESIAAVLLDSIEEDRFNFVCYLTCPNTTVGVYRLQIKNSDNTLDLRSNMVRVMTSGFEDNTTIVRYRNNGRNLFGFNWVVLKNFYQQYRLHIFRIDQQPEYNIEQYRSSTTGKLRNLNGTMDRFVKFQSYYFDKGAHEACEALLFHSEIWINGKLYTFKTGYSSEPLIASKRSKGEFELWDEGFSSLNYCSGTEGLPYDFRYLADNLGRRIIINKNQRIIVKTSI
ncbi:hypothetical protein BWD42_04040 [Sphingobacterium sp. CZ-UAM]|uniref:hypothetical protein n=1 Tax=Sphingobacterium sp. CZ-UAM TaxID=1933868 RepID=UPI00098708AC|nr:hypothetical protein [Sphingobacterium sp. CZ-UAM]OOG19128.1 hypothetical protein BWD42_04040 [Sphingobacterium sp. CZ-UAM]